MSKYSQRFLIRVKDLFWIFNPRTGKENVVTTAALASMQEEGSIEEGSVVENVYERFFANGTYDEVQYQNLEVQKQRFELVLDGLEEGQEVIAEGAGFIRDRLPGLSSPTVSAGPIEEVELEEPAAGEEVEDADGDSNGKGHDSAMVATEQENPGGIDFNPALLNLESHGERIEFNTPSVDQLRGFHFDGLTPVIIQMTPINLPLFLGLETEPASSPPLSLSRLRNLR